MFVGMPSSYSAVVQDASAWDVLRAAVEPPLPRSKGAFLTPDEPDEVTRVMPGQDLFEVEETDGFMVPLEDTAKAM